MADISGKVYLVIGLAVGALSITTNMVQKTNSFTLFAVVGVGMFLWGMYKVIRQKKETHVLHNKQLMGKNHPAKNHSDHVHNKTNNKIVHHNVHPDKYCIKCGNSMKSYANFCSNCGFKMR